MIDETEQLHARLASLEKEIANLRLGSTLTDRRYADAQASLKELTSLSLTTAIRAAVAVETAVLATKKAASVAERLAPQAVFDTTDTATQLAGSAAITSFQAAAAAAETAVEAAVAAATTAKMAVRAVEHESEKRALEAAATATAEAAAAGKRAVDNVVQAVQLAKAVAEFMKSKKSHGSQFGAGRDQA